MTTATTAMAANDGGECHGGHDNVDGGHGDGGVDTGAEGDIEDDGSFQVVVVG